MLDASCDSDPGLDAHNIMRVRSMSDRALQTRIWKIQRVDKLQSFIKVLPLGRTLRVSAVALALAAPRPVQSVLHMPRPA
jgi:hypothetical protein